MATTSRSQRTRDRLAACALDLFETQGYEATGVDEIAAAAGVTPMTFFRHFAAKENVLVDDPYDPLIAAAVGAQPTALPPLARAVRGVRSAWAHIPADDDLRRRIRVVAATPSLRGAMWRSNARTERAIADRLTDDGADPLAAQVAAAAVLAALVTALYAWAEREEHGLRDAVATALDTLDGGPRATAGVPS